MYFLIGIHVEHDPINEFRIDVQDQENEQGNQRNRTGMLHLKTLTMV